MAHMASAPDSFSPALERLMEKFAGVVRRVCWRYHFTGPEVDELLQEVRIRLWHASVRGVAPAGDVGSATHPRDLHVDLERDPPAAGPPAALGTAPEGAIHQRERLALRSAMLGARSRVTDDLAVDQLGPELLGKGKPLLDRGTSASLLGTGDARVRHGGRG